MQIDASMLRYFLSMDDTTLWQTIRTIAAQSGVTLPNGTPPKNELQRLREALGGATPNPEEAMRLIQEYRKKNNL